MPCGVGASGFSGSCAKQAEQPTAIKIEKISSLGTFEKRKQGIGSQTSRRQGSAGWLEQTVSKRPSARKHRVKQVEAAAVESSRAKRLDSRKYERRLNTVK